MFKSISVTLAVVLASSLVTVGCKPQSPKEKAGETGSATDINYDFTLSQKEFDALSKENQYMVARKILAPM